MQVVGYVRVSTDEQSLSGAGLEAQRQTIVAECRRRGWHLVEVIEDAGWSAKDLRRPGIKAALEVLEAGDATALVVAKLDRLSRSLLDFTKLMATRRSRTGRSWRSTARGHLDADRRGDGVDGGDVRAVGAAADLAAPEGGARGQEGGGGSGSAVHPSFRRSWFVGSSTSAPAASRCARSPDSLNADKVPTAQGGKQWYVATVRGTLNRAA
jgi:Resolvase, N terminal domain